MRTLWHLVVGAKAGLVLLWRAWRSEYETTVARIRQRGATCDRCLGSGWNNGGTCPHCFCSGLFTTDAEREVLR